MIGGMVTHGFHLAVAGSQTSATLAAISVIRDQLAQSAGRLTVTWYGTADAPAVRASAEHRFAFRALPLGLPRSILSAVVALRSTSADVVLATEGDSAVSLAAAARITGRPLIAQVHEVTARSNRFLIRCASDVALDYSAYDELPARLQSRAVVTGKSSRNEAHHSSPQCAIGVDGVNPQLPLVCALGGREVDHILTVALPELLRHCQIIHWPGRVWYQRPPTLGMDPALLARYHTISGKQGVAELLKVADLIIGSPGEGLDDVAVAGRPALLIPPQAGTPGTESIGGQILSKAGAAITFRGLNNKAYGAASSAQAAENLSKEVLALIRDEIRLASISENARKFHSLGPGLTLAGLILKYVDC